MLFIRLRLKKFFRANNSYIAFFITKSKSVLYKTLIIIDLEIKNKQKTSNLLYKKISANKNKDLSIFFY